METRERIYEFIKAYIAEHGYSPSLRDICEATGIGSTAHAAYHVDKLAAQGRLTYQPRTSRTIRLTQP